MEVGTFLWIGGVVIVAAGSYVYLKRGKAKRVFIIHQNRFTTLINDLQSDKFDVNKWTDTIVDINDNCLIKWWQRLVNINNHNSEDIKKTLLATLHHWGIFPQFVPILPPERPVNLKQAKVAFMAHLDNFVPLLSALTQTSADIQKWTEAIVDINDDDLTGLWKKCVKSGSPTEKWLQLLASWQIKADSCKSFTCCSEDNVESYTLESGEAIEMGVKYAVVSPCWVLTKEDADGKIQKQVIVKGIVTPKSAENNNENA